MHTLHTVRQRAPRTHAAHYSQVVTGGSDNYDKEASDRLLAKAHELVSEGARRS